MFDDVCSAFRDVIHNAIDADLVSEDSALWDAMEIEGMSIQFTDTGLAIKVEDRLYSIAIERV